MHRSPESKKLRRRIVEIAKKENLELEAGRGPNELAGLERTIRYAMSTNDPHAAIDYVIELLCNLDDYESYASNDPECVAANTLAVRSAKIWYFIQYDRISFVAKKICDVLGGDDD